MSQNPSLSPSGPAAPSAPAAPDHVATTDHHGHCPACDLRAGAGMSVLPGVDHQALVQRARDGAMLMLAVLAADEADARRTADQLYRLAEQTKSGGLSTQLFKLAATIRTNRARRELFERVGVPPHLLEVFASKGGAA